MKTTTIHAAKTNLSRLIEAACAGDEVIISREDIRNGSGRVCGEHLTITDDAWEFIQSVIAEIAE